MNILAAVLIFGIVVAFHEFGHFIVAKLCGVKVEQFTIGFGPAIFKKTIGDTIYVAQFFYGELHFRKVLIKPNMEDIQ